MKIVQKYIDCIKDNPKGYWFKRKVYGWGWTPATREGWFVILVAVVAIVLIALRAENFKTAEQTFKEGFLPILGVIILLIVICYKTGESPKWQWGEPVRGTGARPSEESSERSE